MKATVSYATEDGLFQGATDVQFTVEPGLTGIPTGITYPTYSIAIKPGEQVFLQELNGRQFWMQKLIKNMSAATQMKAIVEHSQIAF